MAEGVRGTSRGAASPPPNGLELSCPAEAGNRSPLYARLAGNSRVYRSPARRVSFSELLARRNDEDHPRNSRIKPFGKASEGGVPGSMQSRVGEDCCAKVRSLQVGAASEIVQREVRPC